MPDTRLYLDHAATTPMLTEAKRAVAQAMDKWANPSSPHGDGRRARAMLEDARRRIADALDWEGEVLLTSGASEAIAIALGRSEVSVRLVSRVEHEAVLRLVGGDARFLLGVDRWGRLDLDALGQALEWAGPSVLVAVQSVNNETGVVQDLAAITKQVGQAGGLLFADCSQSAGKLPLPDADLIAISAHKLGGPPGIGALLVRDLGMLKASGGQEKGYRPGTENLPAAMGFAAALESSDDWLETAKRLRANLDAQIVAAGGEVVAQHAPRLATIAGYRMPGMAANAQLIQFDLAGISVSAGSACSSGTLKTSHVLTAMGYLEDQAGEVVRVSFGPETDKADIDRFVTVWRAIATRAQAA